MNFPKIGFIFLNLCLVTWAYEWILKKIFFKASAVLQKIGFLKFYAIKTSHNLLFYPFYSILLIISFLKMYIICLAQFITFKTSTTVLWLISFHAFIWCLGHKRHAKLEVTLDLTATTPWYYSNTWSLSLIVANFIRDNFDKRFSSVEIPCFCSKKYSVGL